MGQFRNRFGKAFAALLGISMILALGLEACTTVAPTNSPSASPSETALVMQTPALNRTWANTNDGFGGQYPDAMLEQIISGQFAIQEAYIKSWVYYWCNAIVPVTGCDLNPVYLKDPKTGEVIVGMDDNEQILFPPLGDEGKIAWESAPASDPTQEVGDDLDPFRVSKLMTYEIAVAAGYSPEMATALAGTVVGYRNKSIVRLSSDRSRIVADIDPTTRQYRLVEAAAIDRDLLFNFPESRDDFLNRPAEECVWAPNPLDGIDAFNDWVRTRLIPALGDMETNPPNLVFEATTTSNWDGHGLIEHFSLPENALPLQSPPAMFCFDTDLRRYGAVLFKIVDSGGNFFGYRGVILSDESFGSAEASGHGLERLGNMSRGERIVNLYMALNEAPDYSPETNEMIRLGLRGDVAGESGIIFAPGFIQTRP